jgi:hypothetical protein
MHNVIFSRRFDHIIPFVVTMPYSWQQMLIILWSRTHVKVLDSFYALDMSDGVALHSLDRGKSAFNR